MAAAIPLLLSLGFAQEAVIQSDNSRRVIQHWSASGAAASALGQAQARSPGQAAPQYYWAAFSGIVGPNLDRWLADQGIENLGFAGRPGSLRLYKLRIPAGQEALYERLKGVTGFVNLLPVIREEKLSPALLRAEGGARKATVFFHRNGSFPEMKAFLDGKVDEVFPDPDPRLVHVKASPERLRALADLEEVLGVREEVVKAPTNDVSRALTKVDALQAGVLNLTAFPPTPEWNRSTPYTGDSIHVGVNEGFDLKHRDFNEQLPGGALKPRVSHGTVDIFPAWHGSHVAGIIGGNGWNSETAPFQPGARYQWRGVAPKVHFSNWGDKGDVNNHSFTNGDDAVYNYSDMYVDDRLSNHISYQEDYNNVFVWSAANNGGSWAQYGQQRGFYSMLVNAKNPIKVGATTPQGFRAGFSSMGPTRDGRWGPDVVAPGDPVKSVSDGTQDYTWMSGTSMSGPHVTGIAALIMQKYRDAILRVRNPAENVHENPMWNSTVKAILVHTATDLVDVNGEIDWDPNPDFEFSGFPNEGTNYPAGPDFATGFGLVNAQKALEYVDANRFREGVVAHAQTLSYQVTVPAGRANLRATLAWDDPEYLGIADQSNAYAVKLVNDLDLEVVSPTGQVFLPWTLDHAPLHDGTVPFDGRDPITPSEIRDRPAVRGRDAVNNLEVVDVPNPAAGTWTLRVRGQAITMDQSPDGGLNQDFSLVSDFNLPAPPALPAGPDLIVTRILVTPSTPSHGDALTFKAEVRNIGTAATPAGTPVDVELRVFSSPVAYGRLTQSLAAGQSTVVDVNLGPNGEAYAGYPVEYGAWFPFTAWVDYLWAVPERSERNNTLSSGIEMPRLPSPWKSQDIGPVSFGAVGSASYDFRSSPPNIYMGAMGSDIYGTADEFHFMYRPLTGNGEIVGQVINVGAPHEWAKAGLMIREDLTQGARNAFVAVTAAHGTTFQHRSTAGGATATGEIPSDAQGWLRLVRSGNQITGYRGFDGVNWTQVGTVTLALPATVYVGFAATSHDPGYTSSTWFTLRSFSGGVTSSLRGKVLDQNFQPVAGVTLALSGGGTGSALTDAEGAYVLSGLAAGGNFTVTPSKAGYTFTPASRSVQNVLNDVGIDFAAAGTPPPQLPSPWVTGDVGNVGLAGQASYEISSSRFFVSGSGADIWGTADAFRFVHQPFTGDIQITARVNAQGNTDPWAKTGLMIRENTTAGSRHASVFATPSNGVSFQRRTAAGGQSASTTAAGIAAPVWLRLLKVGGNVKAFRSADGIAWTLVGEENMAFAGEFRAGLAVTSHNNTSLSQGTFGNVSATATSAWTSADVGAPGQAGSFTQTGGSYSVRGGGADIWGTSDQFQFVHQAWTGDGQFTARVASVQNTDPWAKAGLMIRASTAAGSVHASVVVTPGNGVSFQRRTATGGQSGSTTAAGLAAPRWIRIVRTGDNIRSFQSADGTAWSLVGEMNIVMPAQVLVGMAVTAHNNTLLNTSAFESVTLEPVTAPVFTATDVGGSVPAGSTTVSGGTYTVKGGGADIWGTADQFHYYHRSMSGDGSITARVASLTNTDVWAKAGVMIRETTANGSRHVYAGLTPTNGAEFLRRTVVNDITTATASPATAPYWVRLTRAGNVFTSFVSTNGTTWTQVGTATIAMAADVRVGLAACSHNPSVLLTGVFDNVTIVE